MKKIIVFLLSLMILTPDVFATEENIEETKKEQVTLVNCLSASTQWIELNGQVKVIKLIAYDKEDGSLNKDIDNFACELLKNSKKIEIEYDLTVTEMDKYNRELVWLWVDDVLLQDELIKKGYGQVNFVNGEYKYLSQVCETQKQAMINSLGIWNYNGIKEKYCNSGVVIGQKQEIVEEEQKKEEKVDTKKLWYMVFVNSGVLLLVLLLVKREKKNG